MNYVLTGATSDIGRAILEKLKDKIEAKHIATVFNKPVGNMPEGGNALDDVNLWEDKCL